jgi:hypothetical protein
MHDLRFTCRCNPLEAQVSAMSALFSGSSMTANILFGVEFDRRHKANGMQATALHRWHPARAWSSLKPGRS